MPFFFNIPRNICQSQDTIPQLHARPRAKRSKNKLWWVASFCLHQHKLGFLYPHRMGCNSFKDFWSSHSLFIQCDVSKALLLGVMTSVLQPPNRPRHRALLMKFNAWPNGKDLQQLKELCQDVLGVSTQIWKWSRYIGDGYPTFDRKSFQWVHKPLLFCLWLSPTTRKQWEFRPQNIWGSLHNPKIKDQTLRFEIWFHHPKNPEPQGTNLFQKPLFIMRLVNIMKTYKVTTLLKEGNGGHWNIQELGFFSAWYLPIIGFFQQIWPPIKGTIRHSKTQFIRYLLHLDLKGRKK